ncbi:Zn-dependent alcohol dehydrogenase [Yinghuangia sp. ASG 101]|uniref:Zn-dependent alcohol dehydrogenase n=1 Tax=Yinghuangia sp. ASG 101 TaxID=2896848 RepID=UPI001E4A76FC|nr:Zn-dependent alcohol dehydrogenase [Yinghuangia sp. ASG 101]UGQ10181.1 Zn-dependent alcohol dehydrogenase [Yinghuangia sp. ASG 101]
MVRAAVLHGVGEKLRTEEIHLPAPGPGRVRVRIAASGVCHSDLSLADGVLPQAFPVVLGHEGAGTVVAVGEGVTHVAEGDPVLLIWAPACGTCWWCENHEPHLCSRAMDAASVPYARLGDGTEVLPGLGTATFAEETVVPAAGAVRLPSGADLAEAALLGCAVTTGTGAVWNTARVPVGASVAVVGLGGVGLSAVQGARVARAATIVAVDPDEGKRELALAMGATDAFAPGPDLAKRVRARTGGRGVDHAFECVGRAATIRTAWGLTRRGGMTTIVGVGAKDDTVDFSALELFHFARTLTGCVYGSTDPVRDVPRLVEHVAAGRIDLGGLVTARIGLDWLDDAFAAMRAGRGARTLVVPGT